MRLVPSSETQVLPNQACLCSVCQGEGGLCLPRVKEEAGFQEEECEGA